MLNKDNDRESHIYEFVSMPSYVNLFSCNASDPLYFHCTKNEVFH